MSAALLVLALLLAGLVLLLAVPVGVAFRLEGIEPLRGQLTIRWLFGLVRLRVGRPGRKATRARTRRERRGGGRRALAVLRRAEFRRRIARLASDLLRSVHVHGLRLRVRLGLGDPADTGRLWAVLGPLGAAARGLRGAEVRIEPEFLDPVLEFQARGRAQVVPLRLLALAVVFALSPPALRAWRTLLGGHA